MTDIQYTQFLYKQFLKHLLALQVIDETGNGFQEGLEISDR